MKRRLALAVVAGLLGLLAFPPFGWWPLAVLSVAGVACAVDGVRPRDGALIGLVYGAALFLPMLHWTATYVGAAPWLILAFSQTWYLALLGAVLPSLQRLRFGPLWAACGWVAEEALRGRFPFGGFPWGRWAFSQSASPLRWFSTIGGAPLVTFAVATAGTLVATAVMSALRASGGRGRPVAYRGTAARLVMAAAVVLAGAVLSVPLRPGAPSHTMTIAGIQGNVPDRGLQFDARRRQVLDNHVAQTLKLAAEVKAGTLPRPAMVLWPENSSDIDPTDNPDAAAQIQRAADAVGVPILVGALLDGPGPTHDTNAGIVWMPSNSGDPGPGQRYVKRHPVPFGEYMPLRSLARIVTDKVNLVPLDMVAGRGNGLLTQTPVPIGDVICFEVAYDALVQSSVRAGAQLLVVQTNNATFGHSAETYQQLAMSRLRAVETGRTVVQIATSGKSAIIAPNGRIISESGALFTSDIMVETVPLSTATTLGVRAGEVPEWVMAACALLGVAICVRSHRRARRQSHTVPLSTDTAPEAATTR